MPLSYLWWLRGVTCYTSSFDNVNDPVIANFKPNIVKLCLLSLKSSLISLIKSKQVHPYSFLDEKYCHQDLVSFSLDVKRVENLREIRKQEWHASQSLQRQKTTNELPGGGVRYPGYHLGWCGEVATENLLKQSWSCKSEMKL